jgi:hypothetical protein
MSRTLLALCRGLRRHPMLVLNAVLLLLVGTAGVRRAADMARAAEPLPADVFIQSIVAQDGDLGWQQLCPDLQHELPRNVLHELTTTQRSIASQQGVSLSIEHVADRPRSGGGEIRFYVGTLHGPDGSTGQKTYVIMTQASGCVDAVQ